MKVQSFILEKNELQAIEVELSLWPGLPGIQFLGLADQHLKESAARIKSAIKSQGFEFPKARQILVNLRPSYLKKNSRGVELAVAAAYLWHTKQVPMPSLSSPLYIYGELGLNGEVYAPEEIYHFEKNQEAIILTGPTLVHFENSVSFGRLTIKNLRDLTNPLLEAPNYQKTIFQRPAAFNDCFYSKEESEILQLAALGEHSLLLAGPSGSGKSFLAKTLHALMDEPSEKIFLESKNIHKHWGLSLSWRPLVQPHSSTPIISLLGGGNIPMAGEITRAHGGILLLDELLEFNSKFLEALRGPFEEGLIRVARQGQALEYPARSQIVATTNLCPCGEAVPANFIKDEQVGRTEVRSEGRDDLRYGAYEKSYRCRFSLIKCRSYSMRLSGPLVDRFEILHFSSKKQDRQISFLEILEKLNKVRLWQKENQKENYYQSNHEAPIYKLKESFNPNCLNVLFPQTLQSERRKNATIRIARSLADLSFCKRVEKDHLQKALHWSYYNFDKLQRWNF